MDFSEDQKQGALWCLQEIEKKQAKILKLEIEIKVLAGLAVQELTIQPPDSAQPADPPPSEPKKKPKKRSKPTKVARKLPLQAEAIQEDRVEDERQEIGKGHSTICF